VDSTKLYNVLLHELTAQLKVLQDKPEETPVTTLRALWFLAAGEPRSAQAAENGELPELNESRQQALRGLLEKRLQGVPLAYLTQRQQFMGIELLAGPEALVPRKETELLGNAAVELIKEVVAREGTATVIDVCTGAGNLAIAYAMYVPQARVYAADLSSDAVNLAKRNAQYTGVADRLEVREGDLLLPFDEPSILETIDILSCNPPYISSAKVDTMHEEIANYEPRLAFDGGPFGIKILQRLIQQSSRFIKPGGWLAFEVGMGQGPAWMQRLNKHKDFGDVRSVSDDAGEIRAVMAQRSQNQ
jgi:release factor glutamine methyltransferase